MSPQRKHKKNLIVSYKNLSDELKEMFKERYPDGYTDYLQRYTKPNGENIFVVPLETDDTSYRIKFDVKVDSQFAMEELDKEPYEGDGDKGDGDAEFVPLQEALDKDDDLQTHSETHVRHGMYEDLLDTDKKPKKKSPASGSLSELGEELASAFSDEYDDEYNERDDDDDDDDQMDDLDREPTDEELADIDGPAYANADIPEEEQERMKGAGKPATAKKRGRPKKDK